MERTYKLNWSVVGWLAVFYGWWTGDLDFCMGLTFLMVLSVLPLPNLLELTLESR